MSTSFADGIFDHSDFCHCLDWKDDICPVRCFRARLTQHLKEMDPPYPWPVSYSHFKGSNECKLRKKNAES